MIRIEEYRVNKTAVDKLNEFGFRSGIFRQLVYKNIIQLEVFLSAENLTWYYQVVDVNHKSLYGAYYDNEYGRNEIAKKVTESVDKIINEMVKNKILIKEVMPNEKSSKI